MKRPSYHYPFIFSHFYVGGEITPLIYRGEINPGKPIDFRPFIGGGPFHSIYNDRLGAYLVAFFSAHPWWFGGISEPTEVF